MRMRWAIAVMVAAVTCAVAGIATPAAADPPGDVTWSPDLATGQGAGIVVRDGGAHLDPPRTFTEGGADGGAPTGLLTFPAQDLDRAAGEVDAAVAADGAGATVDVRGLRASGNWTEWLPADGGRVTLPEATRRVQARLVLTGTPGPLVTGLTLTARRGALREGTADAAPLRVRVFATREGLVGGTTANGHVIVEDDHFVALPSRRALSPRDSSDYSVRVCAANGRCAFAPVWDVGPWNVKDDYWNAERQQFPDLPHGRPEAAAAFHDGYNGGKDGSGRTVKNPAGIDLGDGVFRNALGLRDNAIVTVDYLWTGDTRLAQVVADPTVDVLGAPEDDAPVVGTAAEGAGVPVTCETAGYVSVGVGQWLRAADVPDLGQVPDCDRYPVRG